MVCRKIIQPSSQLHPKSTHKEAANTANHSLTHLLRLGEGTMQLLVTKPKLVEIPRQSKCFPSHQEFLGPTPISGIEPHRPLERHESWEQAVNSRKTSIVPNQQKAKVGWLADPASTKKGNKRREVNDQERTNAHDSDMQVPAASVHMSNL